MLPFNNLIHKISPLAILGLGILGSCTDTAIKRDYATWESYLGDQARTHYSSLDQINKENVGMLEVAWTYHTGDGDDKSYIQCNPLIIDSTLFGTSPKLKVFAINAKTGKELWTFDPFAGTDMKSFTRGLLYDDNKLYFTAGKYLHSLHATTGTPYMEFGEGGKIDLTKGLDREITGLSYSYHAPAVKYKNLLIMGAIVSESLPAAPGHIRAFDLKTGEQKWIFHTIPHPGEFGYDTWEDTTAYQFIGGANNWTGMTVDEERGIVFVPTGSASYDFYGTNRKGANLFANCLLALNAETGERIWHFQAVHHDIWDRDFPAPPTLVTIQKDGRSVDAVVQLSKSGHVYVFDRETGESLFPIEEKSYPKSDLYGEETWPTQPLPLAPPPFAKQSLTENDLNPYTKNKDELLRRFRTYRSGGQFVPPSTEGTLIYPGLDGGGEWGGAGFDPTTGVLYVNANEMAWILKMLPIVNENTSELQRSGKSIYQQSCMSCHGADFSGSTFHGEVPSLVNLKSKMYHHQAQKIIENGKGNMPSFAFLGGDNIAAVVDFLMNVNHTEEAVDSTHGNPVSYRMEGYQRFLDEDGYPGVAPPWGTLNAIDLNSGTIVWSSVLGEYEELTRLGIPKTGTENYGGPIVTAGGLVFIGATEDEHFRAFDKETGAELWKFKLPASAQATPATYQLGDTQYVVIAAAGGKGTKIKGDAYIAFKLPQ